MSKLGKVKRIQRVVTAFKQAYPDKLIFADMKTMDAGELEAELTFQAGADITTVERCCKSNK